MIDFNKCFIYTAPFIYFLENHPYYFLRARAFFENSVKNRKILATSVVTSEEYMVQPFKRGQVDLIS